jgi:hypothetical protein
MLPLFAIGKNEFQGDLPQKSVGIGEVPNSRPGMLPGQAPPSQAFVEFPAALRVRNAESEDGYALFHSDSSSQRLDKPPRDGIPHASHCLR